MDVGVLTSQDPWTPGSASFHKWGILGPQRCLCLGSLGRRKAEDSILKASVTYACQLSYHNPLMILLLATWQIFMAGMPGLDMAEGW